MYMVALLVKLLYRLHGMQNASLDDHKVESRILTEYQQSQTCWWCHLMAQNEEELKSLLMRVKEQSERVDVGLKFNIWKTKIMASGPITSWQIESGNSDIFYCLVLQNHFRQWLRPWNSKMFAPWQKSYDKPRLCIKKQRHYFADKGPSGQSYSFSSSHVWMWEFSS